MFKSNWRVLRHCFRKWNKTNVTAGIVLQPPRYQLASSSSHWKVSRSVDPHINLRAEIPFSKICPVQSNRWWTKFINIDNLNEGWGSTKSAELVVYLSSYQLHKRERFKWSCLYCVFVYVAVEAVISAVILVVSLLWLLRIIHFGLGLITPGYEANSVKTDWDCRQVYVSHSLPLNRTLFGATDQLG